MNTLTRIGTNLTILMLTGGHALAQDFEPMVLGLTSRALWIEVEEEFLDIEPYHNYFGGTGLWMDSATVTDSDADGSAAQITRIDEDYIGGLISSEMGSWGGAREESGANFYALFTVERTGRLHAFADFGGSFSDDESECHGNFMLKRNPDDGPHEVIFLWSTVGSSGSDAERSYSMSTLLEPGPYFVYGEVQTNVHGVEIDPDHGAIEFFGAIQLERLPDCGEPGSGACDQPKLTPSCDDESCCNAVCEIDPFCCSNEWDGLCVDRTATACVPSHCKADLNEDGVVNGADQGLLFAAWGPHPPTYLHPADFNQDMVVNGEDLGILMAEWGDC